MPSSSHSNSVPSESDSDCDQDLVKLPPPQHNRTNYLSTFGLIQRPVTDEQQTLPPLPPNHSSSPSISPLQSTSAAVPNTSIRCPQDDSEILDPLSKMEAAFAKYLGIERQPCPDPSSSKSHRSSYHHTQQRRASKSVSTQRPASEDLKASRSSQHPFSHRRPSSLESSLSSTGNGFRAWFNGVSKSVSNMSTHSTPQTQAHPKHHRHRSSISGLRSSFSNPPSDQPRPSVSGPIDSFNPHHESRSPLSNGPTPTSPNFNTGGYVETRTWSGLMDPTTLSFYSEKDKNRQEAIFELINTEATFVENCQILSQVFYLDLQPVIGSRATAKIFSNIEDIMMFGTTFLSALERRQMESGFHVTRIGDIVMAYMIRVDVFRPYCSNQTYASRLLNDLKQKPAVSNRLNGLKVKGLELGHYLLQPMQRLTRYPLLITQIMKYTDEDSSDFERLGRALKKVQQVLVATNEDIRRQEDHFILASLSEKLMIPGSDAKLNLASITRFVGPRRLIREGLVIKSRSRKTLHCYLFNDFFLLTKPPTPSSFLDTSQSPRNNTELMYRAPMALEQCQFLPGSDDHSFVALYGSETFNLKVVDGPKVCKAWLEDLTDARAEVFKALAASKSKRATWATGQRRSGSLERPIEDSPRRSIIYNDHHKCHKKDNDQDTPKSTTSLSITCDTAFDQVMGNPSSSILPCLNKKSIRMPM